MQSVVTLLMYHRLHGTYQIYKIKYTECQKKLHTLTSYCFTYFQNSSVRYLVPKCLKDIALTFAKPILVLKLPENMFFYKPCDYHSGRGYCTVRKVREVTLRGFGR